MTISFENTLQDIIAYNNFSNFHRPRLRRLYQRKRLIATLAVFVLPLSLARVAIGHPLHDSSAWIIALLGAAFIFCLFPQIWRYAIRRQALSMIKVGAYKAFTGNHTLTVAPDGIHSVSPLGESRYHWNAITEVKRSDEQIFLFISETAALPLPRRAFADAAQEAAFLAEIERYRAGAGAVSASATTATPATQISNAPWWSGQTAASADAEETTNVNPRNG